MIRAVNQSQFTPKMKANAVSRLLSTLVWIDQNNECNQSIAPIIFGKMHFLLISENEFTHEIKYNGMTSFTEFMCSTLQRSTEPIALGYMQCIRVQSRVVESQNCSLAFWEPTNIRISPYIVALVSRPDDIDWKGEQTIARAFHASVWLHALPPLPHSPPHCMLRPYSRAVRADDGPFTHGWPLHLRLLLQYDGRLQHHPAVHLLQVADCRAEQMLLLERGCWLPARLASIRLMLNGAFCKSSSLAAKQSLPPTLFIAPFLYRTT